MVDLQPAVLFMEAESKKDQKSRHKSQNGQDNAQMLVDIKATLDQHKVASSEDHRKQKSSSPSQESVSSGTGGGSPRTAMALPRSGSACSDLQSRRRKLAMIRKSLKPFAHSDPGFNTTIIEKANKKYLAELCALGYDEVRIPKTIKYMCVTFLCFVGICCHCLSH